MDNISKCKSSYCGTVYNINNSKAVALMDRVKPYQYLYDVICYRMEQALSKWFGKGISYNITHLPKSEGFDIEKWLYYLTNIGVSFFNPYEEDLKGERLGEIKASAPTQEWDMDQGQYINNHIGLLSFLESSIGDISGVTRQRRGEIQASEAVRNVQQGLLQTSTITEKWFIIHGEVKKRVIEALIDVARECWRGKSKKVQYVLDDMGTAFLNIDEAVFENVEYGVFVTGDVKDKLAYETLRELTLSGLQNDKLNFSQVMDIVLSSSTAATRRKIERFEKERAEREEMYRQQELEIQQKQIEYQSQKDVADREENREISIRESNTKIEVALINAESGESVDDKYRKELENDKEREVKKERTALQKEKAEKDRILKEKKLEEEKRKNLEIERQAKEKLKIEREKIKSKPAEKK